MKRNQGINSAKNMMKHRKIENSNVYSNAITSFSAFLIIHCAGQVHVYAFPWNGSPTPFLRRGSMGMTTSRTSFSSVESPPAKKIICKDIAEYIQDNSSTKELIETKVDRTPKIPHTPQFREDLVDSVIVTDKEHELAQYNSNTATGEFVLKFDELQKKITDASSKLKRITGAATLNHQRIAHSSLGIASLALGSYHYNQCISYGFDFPVSQPEIFFVGGVHIACAFVGLTRLNFNNKSETYRTSVFLQSVITNVLFFVLTLTELCQRADRIIISLYDNHFLTVFTVFNVLFSVRMLKEAWTVTGDKRQMATGLWIKDPLWNTVSQFLSYQFWVLGVCYFTLMTTNVVDPYEYCSFMWQSPQFTSILANTMVTFMTMNNIVPFLVTLSKYKLIPGFGRTRSLMYIAVILFFLWQAIGEILPTAKLADDGMAYDTYFSMLYAFLREGR